MMFGQCMSMGKRTVAEEKSRIKGAADLLQNDVEGVDDT